MIKSAIKLKNLNYLTLTKNYTEIYKLKLNSEKEISISSKDSKGDPLIYKMSINTNLEIYSEGNIINRKNISKSFSYKNTSNKFDLKQYEKTIEDNLIETIKEEIILMLYN